MEQNMPTIAKKIWNTIRVAYFLLKKGIYKRKILMNLNMMMKRGKITVKPSKNLMFHHQSHHDSASNVGMDGAAYLQYMATHALNKEYEFSCSNTPLYRQYFNKRKTHQNYMPSPTEDINNIEAVNNMFDMMMLSCNKDVQASPSLPTDTSLRLTDSPYPMQHMESGKHVDEAAEEFIKNFYKQLNQEKYH